MSAELLQHEFTEWMQANGFAPDAGDASEILASGKLDGKQAAYVRDFIDRWERAAEGVECWHVDTNAARIVVKDENGLPVAMVTGDPTEKSVQESAYLLAAAPELRAALAALQAWCHDNVAFFANDSREDSATVDDAATLAIAASQVPT